ncbi:MAG: FkbM family methyltransferase [Limnothrix sp.]
MSTIASDQTTQETPGSWIFSRDILAWLNDKELTQQLPLPYQKFAEECNQYFQENDAFQIKDGSHQFQELVAACRSTDSEKQLGLQLPHCQIFLNLEDPRFFQVVNELLSEETDKKVVKELLKPGDSFFDIGANHGSFSIIASQILGDRGTITAVEAQPTLANLVRQSLAANVKCEFEVYQIALGDHAGEIDFMIPVDSSGSAGIFAGHSATHQYKKVTVSLQRFDDLVDSKKFKPNGLMKLDIEGSEYSFLQGASRTVRELKPKIILEINPGTLKASGVGIEKLKGLLEALGYRFYTEVSNLDARFALESLKADSQRNIVVFDSY